MIRAPAFAALGRLSAMLMVTVRSAAGPDKVAFPADFKSGMLYTVTDRYDIKQYRELYATPDAVNAAREGKPLPSGTVLTLIQYKAQLDAQGNPLKDAQGRFLKGDLLAYTVMEKRSGWGRRVPGRSPEWGVGVRALRRGRQVQRQRQLQGVLPVPQAA